MKGQKEVKIRLSKKKIMLTIVLLIVIILAVALTITVNGSLVSRNNLAIMKSKYSEIIQDHYSKDTNNLSAYLNDKK